MPYPTCNTRCLLLILSSWSFVLQFVFKSQFWLWQCRLSEALFSSNSSCALKVPEISKARALSLSLFSVDFDAERELPGPSAFDFDFSVLHPSHSRAFPHELAERSPPLHQTGKGAFCKVIFRLNRRSQTQHHYQFHPNPPHLLAQGHHCHHPCPMFPPPLSLLLQIRLCIHNPQVRAVVHPIRWRQHHPMCSPLHLDVRRHLEDDQRSLAPGSCPHLLHLEFPARHH